MDMVKSTHDATPASSMPGQGDHPTAVALYAAIVTALYRRTITGKGGYVNTSLLANGLWANGCMLQGKFEEVDFTGLFPAPPRTERQIPLANIYRCGCNRWLFLTILNDRQFAPLCQVLGRPDLADNPKYATADARRENNVELISLLDKLFAEKERHHWTTELSKVGITFAQISTLDDVAADPQPRAAGLVVPFADGKSVTVNSPFELRGVPKVPFQRAATVGQHTKEVLSEVGFTREEVEAMIRSGAAFVGPRNGSKL